MITRGPVIYAELSWLLGAILWVVHCTLTGQDMSGFGSAVSCGAGYFAIALISAGTSLLMNPGSHTTYGNRQTDGPTKPRL